MKVLWIGGWGTMQEWGLMVARRWRPEWEHEWVSPTSDCSERADGSHDWVGGYSFGAFLMLRRPQDFPSKNGHFFLAPFLDLKLEAGLGGLVSTTQLTVLRKWLERDPCAAVSDFYQRAGLSIQLEIELPYDKQDLLWGIDTLLGESAPIPTGNESATVLGGEDPLIDAATVSKFFPKSIVVPEAGHRLEDFRESLDL